MTDVGLTCSNIDKIQMQDVALFIMGKFKEEILILTEDNKQFVQKLIFDEMLKDDVHELIKIRILWLIERLASHD